MVDPSAVLAAKKMLKAAQAPNMPSMGSVSPLMAQYGGNGWGGAYANALPRPAQDFTDAAFGPLAPIRPMGINEPVEGLDRPSPRRWPYPVGWDMPVGQPGSEGFKLANFNTLRTLGNLYSVARSCIRLRINELRGMAWDITPTKEAEKAMRADHGAHQDFQERRAEAMKFFKRPDPDYHDFSSWLAACMEEVFVIDALSLYLQPTLGASTTWGKGKGLLGSDLSHLCLIDGATVRPLVDVYGAVPRPPSVAYQVYEYGVPRVDLMTLITEDDRADMGNGLAAEYRGDQLLYLPYNPQRWTPYGFTPIEGAIVPVIAGLRKQQWQSNYFDEGTIPRAFISPGDAAMTPGQIQELQNALNAIAGDVAWHHKIIVLPPGSKVEPMVNTELADAFDEIVMTQVCMGFDVMPMELGIMPKVSTTQTAGAANQMAKASETINQRKSLKPLMLWLKTCIFDKILQDVCNQWDMEWRWEALAEGEDEEALISMLVTQINSGLMSIDEARVELGRQPWGLAMTSDPGVLLPAGFVPLGAIDPVTGAPAAQQPAQPGEAGVAQPAQPAPGEPVPAPPAPPGAAPAKPAPTAPAPASTPASPGHTSGTAANAAASKPGSGASPPRGPVKPGASKPEVPPAGAPVKAATTKGWQSTAKPLAGDAAAETVFQQLSEDYPVGSLGWVRDAEWSGPQEVPVAQIDTSNVKEWQAADEPLKVERFKKKIKHKLGKGKPLKPVVLVKTPDNTKLIVIDGHHRTMAYDQLDLPAIAWVGKVKKEVGPWDTLHNQQYPEDGDPGTDDDTRRAQPSGKAVLSELDALRRHLHKGRHISTWACRHLSAGMLGRIREDLGKGLTIDQAVSVARSSLPARGDSDLEGDLSGC